MLKFDVGTLSYELLRGSIKDMATSVHFIIQVIGVSLAGCYGHLNVHIRISFPENIKVPKVTEYYIKNTQKP